MSHPIPFHTAERLERALDALFRRVGARGAKGWVKRIVAFFFCQYCEAVIELLEGLLAEYRAGTLVFPSRVDNSAAGPAVASPRPPASRRVRAPRANVPRATLADAAEPSDAPAPRRLTFTVSPGRAPIDPREPAPCAVGFHPSAVPRRPLTPIGAPRARAFARLFRYDKRTFRRMGKRSATHHLLRSRPPSPSVIHAPPPTHTRKAAGAYPECSVRIALVRSNSRSSTRTAAPRSEASLGPSATAARHPAPPSQSGRHLLLDRRCGTPAARTAACPANPRRRAAGNPRRR